MEIVLDLGVADAIELRDLILTWRDAGSQVRVHLESLQQELPGMSATINPDELDESDAPNGQTDFDAFEADEDIDDIEETEDAEMAAMLS